MGFFRVFFKESCWFKVTLGFLQGWLLGSGFKVGSSFSGQNMSLGWALDSLHLYIYIYTHIYIYICVFFPKRVAETQIRVTLIKESQRETNIWKVSGFDTFPCKVFNN